VKLAPRQSSIEFDHLIQVSPPFAFKEQEALSLFLVGDSSYLSNKRERRLGYRDLLVDTFMEVNQAFFMVWENPHGTIVQQIGFVVKPLVPQITGYRVNRNFDSLDNSVHAKQHKRKPYIPLG
ncbi:hypothetical protein VJI72_07915, partial [Parvimonas micra]|uniref:hypothetical protein n=1 Tax=Parvimonas micra TaxID=33033 RepID=UPI002B45DF66